MLIEALNPCPYGFMGDKEKICICSQNSIERYNKKLSGTILDRVDIFINVPRVKIEDFDINKTKKTSSEELKIKVENTRLNQLKIFNGASKAFNTEMSNKEIEK